VGLWIGDFVGLAEGVSVGVSVGAAVGIVDGFTVGFTDGPGVGGKTIKVVAGGNVLHTGVFTNLVTGVFVGV
jgi:hypothetical protein